MTENHRALIEYFEQNSLIREYCQCDKALSSAYNGVINVYS
jgi:hypothetical protein